MICMQYEYAVAYPNGPLDDDMKYMQYEYAMAILTVAHQPPPILMRLGYLL